MGLILAWGGIISIAILLYVLLDGFDLGIGILFPWLKNAVERDIVMSTVAPVWDGNETWLVFGAAALYACFPKAYGTLLPALYFPITFMLIALIFRGVAFEFRFKAHRSQFIWDGAFLLGSVVASFMQGAILGTYVQSFTHPLINGIGTYAWLTPFSICTGVAVVVGYALLGSTWLIIKTTGTIQKKMYQLAPWLLGIVTGFLVIISIWTPLIDVQVQQRWFTYPHFYYLFPLPLITGLLILLNFFLLKRKKSEQLPFLLSIGLFILAYAGFCISAWPYIIPNTMTLWEAAAPRSSLIFTLVGAAIILPILLVYTVYAYYVFRGKVTKTIHY